MLDIYQRFFGELREQEDEIRDLLRGDVPRFHRLLMRQPDFDLSEVRFRADRLQAGQAWLAAVAERYERYLRDVFQYTLQSPISDPVKEFLLHEKMLRQTSRGPVAILKPRPTRIELDRHEVHEMYLGLRESRKLADALSGPDGRYLRGFRRAVETIGAPSLDLDLPEASSESSSETPGAGRRQIIVTGHERLGASVRTFEPHTRYELRLRVADWVFGNLAQGDTDVTDLPPGGLDTRWLVSSSTIDFLGLSSGEIRKRRATWLAEFDLHIPSEGDSDTVSLDILTTEATGELRIDVMNRGERYRTCTVRLDAGARRTSDVVGNSPPHLNLNTTHEWTTPPEHIHVSIVGQVARILTVRGANDYGIAEWLATDAVLTNPIQRVRGALEKLRMRYERYFNALDETDLASRITGDTWRSNIWPGVGWSQLQSSADHAHEQESSGVLQSKELRALASEGYRLFDTCFPEGNELRQVLKSLMPGSRVDLSWRRRDAIGWVSHVPWALMYLDAPTVSGAIDCERFLGLRFRLGSYSWEPRAPSRALGAPGSVHALHFLYWGNAPNDDVGVQSAWQRQLFATWQAQRFLPDPSSTDPKHEMLSALESPSPDPAGILYFYCHCNVKDGSDPILQFGDDATGPNTVNASEIYQGRLASGPLVFANACTTVASDPQGSSELESTFFRRDIRAFLGTETKVPVGLASHFAWLFFQFFFRHADPDHAPMAAGEALAQSRLFLWTQYRNVGGLFYSLVNQYDLFLASDEEVRRMAR